MPPRQISPEVFAVLSALIEERAGLHYSMTDRDILADKVSARADEAGFESLLDYYYFLRYDDRTGAEMEALVDALVVNETYLFREIDQLEVLVEEFIRPAVESGRTARVWSAACSTGEEPLGLAMMLDRRGLLERTKILASDISERALARARSGVIPSRSLARSPKPAYAEGYLTAQGNELVVSPRIFSAVEWRRLNLLDDKSTVGLGPFDVVLARNVFIYFRDDTTRRVAERLRRTLLPGGALFVGVSESLMRFGLALSCEEHGGVFVYRSVST